MNPRSGPLAGGIFAAACFAVLAVMSRSFPVIWDETIYFDFSDHLRRWAALGFPMDAPSLQAFWDYSAYHNPHPPFFKVLSALTSAQLGFVGFPLNYRLPHLLFASFACAALFLSLRRRFGGAGAALAVACAALQPRVFGELLVGTTDGPTLLAWLCPPVLLWCREKEDDARARRAMGWAFAVILAAACATKVTALLAVLPLSAWCAWRRRGRDLLLTAASAAAGVAAASYCSPVEWAAPLKALSDYLFYPFTRHEVPISTFYLGRLYDGLDMPWHTFTVMTLATMPPLLLAAVPAAAWTRGEARSLAKALLWLLGFWVALVHVPGVPRHDGVRQFVSVYPLLGLLAWAGWSAMADRLRAAGVAGRALLALQAFPGVYLAFLLLASHPFEMSYYSGVAGGLRGAERRGMEISYALEPVGAGLADWINAHAPAESRVGMYPAWSPLLTRYQREGRLRPDLLFTPREEIPRWDYVVLCRRRSQVNDVSYAEVPAAHEVRHGGVSLGKVIILRDQTEEPPTRSGS